MASIQDQAPRPADDQVPIAELPRRAARVVSEVQRTGRPTMITRGGETVAVLLGIDAYKRLEEDAWAAQLIRDLREAEAEIERGGGIPHEQVVREFEARWGKPLPTQ